MKHILFAASVNDLNVCTGEHWGANVHGSCTAPWSFFAIFHATSADGLPPWTLVNHKHQNANVALQHAAFYYEPSPAEMSGDFKGIAAAHAVVADDGYVHVFAEFWRTNADGAGPQRNIHLRTKDMREFDIWLGEPGWNAVIDGRVPAWVNASGIHGKDSQEKWRGEPFPLIISSVHRLEPGGEYKYLLTAAPPDNDVYLAYSHDLVQWTPQQKVGWDDPTFAAAQKLNPFAYEQDGELRLLFGASLGSATYGGIAVYEGRPSLLPKSGKPRIVSHG
jgi:hypothetical protein